MLTKWAAQATANYTYNPARLIKSLTSVSSFIVCTPVQFMNTRFNLIHSAGTVF